MNNLINFFKIRQRERNLLVRAAITVIFGFYLVYSALPPPSKIFIWYPAIILVFFFIIHIILYFICPHSDEIILPVVLLLSFLGLIMIYRINQELAVKQFIWLTLSLAGMSLVIIIFRKGKLLEKYTYIWALTGILFLIITIIFGKEINGAKLWISIGPVNIQPVEIVKFMLVLFLANYLKEHRKLLLYRKSIPGWWRVNFRYIIPLLFLYGLSLSILVIQRDLGMALLLFGIFIAMFYCATGRWDYCSCAILAFISGAISCYYIFSHLQVRVETWINPWIDMDGKGYQITQGLFAFAAGGIWGKGLGLGEPHWVPVVESDFIFSAFGEELGLTGTIAIIMLYIILIERGMKISLSSKSNFKQILSLGIVSVFAIQTLVIMGGVLKIIPLTGITLPFMSYGGSSLLSNYLALGIILTYPESEEL